MWYINYGCLIGLIFVMFIDEKNISIVVFFIIFVLVLGVFFLLLDEFLVLLDLDVGFYIKFWVGEMV